MLYKERGICMIEQAIKLLKDLKEIESDFSEDS